MPRKRYKAKLAASTKPYFSNVALNLNDTWKGSHFLYVDGDNFDVDIVDAEKGACKRNLSPKSLTEGSSIIPDSSCPALRTDRRLCGRLRGGLELRSPKGAPLATVEYLELFVDLDQLESTSRSPALFFCFSVVDIAFVF